jgi:hypothetical protein
MFLIIHFGTFLQRYHQYQCHQILYAKMTLVQLIINNTQLRQLFQKVIVRVDFQ